MDNTLVFIMVKQPKRFFLFFLIDIDFLLKRLIFRKQPKRFFLFFLIDIDFLLKRLIFRKMPFHLLAQKVFLMLRLKFL
jgi:hypothetical protein